MSRPRSPLDTQAPVAGASPMGAQEPKPTVVLLHGLARTRFSLSGIRRHLERAGYPTWAMTYDWRGLDLPSLAAEVARKIRAETRGELVAVTHSFGGILVRHMGEHLRFRSLVMVAPPNRGSLLARAFQDVSVYRWMHGKSGDEVTSSEGWPAPPAPFGVIAGTRSLSVANPVSWLARGMRLLPKGEPSDGTLTVEETRHPAMTDFATVDASHTLILDHPEARALILRFLSTHRFR